jgi:hypothetical protein
MSFWKKVQFPPGYWKQVVLAARQRRVFGMAGGIFSVKTDWRSIPFSCL